MTVAERGMIQTCPYSTSVWHDEKDPPPLGHDTPDFAEQLAELFNLAAQLGFSFTSIG